MMLATARSTSAVESSAVARMVGERDVEHRLGLGRHVAGEIEAREIERARRALGFRRIGGGCDQLATCAR